MRKKSKIVISGGKGGIGKSMLASALAMLFSKRRKVSLSATRRRGGLVRRRGGLVRRRGGIIALDCDVDAPNLGIWLNEVGQGKTKKYTFSQKPIIDFQKCIGCGKCVENCQFKALEMVDNKPVLNNFSCEGCGVCEIVCPEKAVKFKSIKNGQIRVRKTKYGFPLIIGELKIGETGSGKIVSQLKEIAEKYEHEIAIIDSSPGTGCPVIAALQDATFVVLITEPTPSAFSDLKRVLQVVNYFKIPWGLVINKWDINPRLSSKVEKWAGKKILGKISYDQNIFKAVANLVPIMETSLRAKKEIEDIFTNLSSNLIKLNE